MPRLLRRRSAKRGMPPGTLVHVGERKTEKTKISVFDYDADEYREQPVEKITECAVFRNQPTVTWIDFVGLHDVKLMERLGQVFELHSLVLEDILNTDQRPKAQDYGSYVYVVLKMFHQDVANGEIIPEQISLVLGQDFVISFQEREGDAFDPVRDRIRTSKGRIRTMKSDYLLYALLDAIVDSYFAIVERLTDRTEEIEDDLIDSPSPETLQTLYYLKREVLYLRKSVRPLRDLVGVLERGESALIGESMSVYLRDLYDHIIQVTDTVETLREMLMGMLDIYLSSVSNRMNAVMKVLTIIATIFIPLTFLAGIYGMNFEYMPELGWRWSYAVLWGIMLTVFCGMVIYFKKKDWL